MPKIHVMTDALASQVAAGEVVERPASVVKELIENSIDAGALRINIEVDKGGVALIKVTDDGCGMTRDDALLAIERHATSKLFKASDLDCLSTYGFRGEALPSVASVSKFRLSTCETKALAGAELIVEGGNLVKVSECGAAKGTQIEVRDLFYNIPARRKFLKTQATEFRHIEEVVRLAAIVQPSIAFTLHHDSREVRRLAASTQQINRISDLVGVDVIDHLIEFKGGSKQSGLEVNGWVSEPAFSRRNRKMQYFFLNGRPIETAAISSALKEAYTGFIDRGAFPSAFIFVNTDPANVDVNVHPAKREVRFRNQRHVQELVTESVQKAITSRFSVSLPDDNTAKINLPSTEQLSSVLPNASDRILSGVNVSDSEDCSLDYKQAIELDWAEPQLGESNLEVNIPSEKDSTQRVIGVLDQRYVIVEGSDGLVLLHKRAAHERILYEDWMAVVHDQGCPSQSLLAPVTLELSATDCELVISNTEILSKMGLNIELFGGTTIKVDSLPSSCGDVDPIVFFNSVVTALSENGLASAKRLSESDLVAIVCSRAARYNESNSIQELNALVRRLKECDMPYCDTRGRPTMVQFSFRELERRFNVTPTK